MTDHAPPDADGSETSAALLAWYDAQGRSLPWRARAGERGDPYRVWLSEIMLQQTTVAAVKGHYARFLERFPDIEALAEAEPDAVMQAWAGLGYYARARNLHACAKEIVARGGAWPRTVAGLRELPGIGAYTAAAVGAICFATPDVPLDGNIERVVSRMTRMETPLPKAREPLRRAAQGFRTPERPGDIAQALMDLGATICTPRNPVCALCPVDAWCAARRSGDQTDYPKKTPKKPVPRKTGRAWVARDGAGRILMRRRPDNGLLGGLWMPPAHWPGEAEDDAPPFEAHWRAGGEAAHGFTHFKLTLTVMTARSEAPAPAGLTWIDPTEIGVSTLLKRILAASI